VARIPRIKFTGDVETPEVSSVIDLLKLFGERLGTGLKGHEAIAHDSRDAEAMWQLMKAQIRRANLSVSIHRHNCPHVPGFEEPSWVACTDPQYGYEIEVVN
jgi:hypothetical protein